MFQNGEKSYPTPKQILFFRMSLSRNEQSWTVDDGERREIINPFPQ